VIDFDTGLFQSAGSRLMKKSTVKRTRLCNPLPAQEADPADLVNKRDLVVARLRRAEEWVRDARVRVQGAFPGQASEALDDMKRANEVLNEARTMFVTMGVTEGVFS
jgi:hypothetical protein